MFRRPDSYYQATLDQLLPPSTALRNLTIKLTTLYHLHRMVPKLGNLANIAALKHLSITGPGGHQSPFDLQWSAVDARLAEVGSGLEEVRMDLDESRFKGDAALLFRQSLPILDARGILKISLLPRVSGMKCT